jgi:cytochrome c-type biogenesis protein CcsB
VILLKLLSLLLPLVSFSNTDPFARTWKNEDWKKEAGILAVQSGGRTKPLDTFAREAVELLTGRETFKKKDSIEILFSLAFEPQVWQQTEFLQLGNRELKKDLGLDEKKSHFSPQELMHSQRLMPIFQELDVKQKAQEKLDPYFQAVQRLAHQMNFLQELISGRLLRLVPPDPETWKSSDAWLGFDKFSQEQQVRFTLIAAGFTSADPKIQEKLGEYVGKFGELAKAQNPTIYPQLRDLKLERHFNELRPFRWAWILALLSTILLTVTFYRESLWLYRFGMLGFLASFLFQAYGFALRCWIAGRPPVSNMYESVIWVAFGCMAFGLVFESIYRKRIIAIGALIFATLSLIIADTISGVVDDGIHPLEPVLRSNLWLTVHVLTITLGYAAFAISLVLGNIAMGQWVFVGKESKELPMRLLAFYSYRAVQVGIVLLAAGTILGGVWADYSWGRFWGWDPKETWALIALLGYLALVHARFRGLVGPFGFLVGCVVAFLGVLMAWYGVNFVLGAGLHSYGFSSGGVSYVATYCCLQLLFLGIAAWARKAALKETKEG